MHNAVKDLIWSRVSSSMATSKKLYYYKMQESSRKYEIKFQKFLSIPQYFIENYGVINMAVLSYINGKVL